MAKRRRPVCKCIFPLSMGCHQKKPTEDDVLSEIPQLARQSEIAEGKALRQVVRLRAENVQIYAMRRFHEALMATPTLALMRYRGRRGRQHLMPLGLLPFASIWWRRGGS